jgi:hypothetical protein
MAIIDKNTLKANISGDVADNFVGGVSPADVRGNLISIVDTMATGHALQFGSATGKPNGTIVVYNGNSVGGGFNQFKTDDLGVTGVRVFLSGEFNIHHNPASYPAVNPFNVYIYSTDAGAPESFRVFDSNTSSSLDISSKKNVRISGGGGFLLGDSNRASGLFSLSSSITTYLWSNLASSTSGLGVGTARPSGFAHFKQPTKSGDLLVVEGHPNATGAILSINRGSIPILKVWASGTGLCLYNGDLIVNSGNSTNKLKHWGQSSSIMQLFVDPQNYGVGVGVSGSFNNNLSSFAYVGDESLLKIESVQLNAALVLSATTDASIYFNNKNSYTGVREGCWRFESTAANTHVMSWIRMTEALGESGSNVQMWDNGRNIFNVRTGKKQPSGIVHILNHSDVIPLVVEQTGQFTQTTPLAKFGSANSFNAKIGSSGQVILGPIEDTSCKAMLQITPNSTTFTGILIRSLVPFQPAISIQNSTGDAASTINLYAQATHDLFPQLAFGPLSASDNGIVNISRTLDGGLASVIENRSAGTSAYCGYVARNVDGSNANGLTLLCIGSGASLATPSYKRNSAVLEAGSSLTAGLQLSAAAASASGGIWFFSDGGSAGPRMWIDVSGRLGIGTRWQTSVTPRNNLGMIDVVPNRVDVPGLYIDAPAGTYTGNFLRFIQNNNHRFTVNAIGQCFLGTLAGLSPTGALLYLAPTGGGAGAVHLKLLPKTIQSTPERDALEYDGTSLYFTNSAGTRVILGTGGGAGGSGGGGGGMIVGGGVQGGSVGYILHVDGTGVLAQNSNLYFDTTNQRLSIRNVGPGITANLHIGSGGAGAGSAPLKFQSGLLLTTTETGAVEFNGTRLNFTPSTARRNLVMNNEYAITFRAPQHEPPTGNFPTLYNRNARPVLDFPSSGTFFTHFCEWMPLCRGTGSINVEILWSPRTIGSGGQGIWSASFEKVSANDIDTDSFSVTKGIFSVRPSDTAGHIGTGVITFNSDEIDSILPGDYFRLKISRSGSIDSYRESLDLLSVRMRDIG